MPTVTLTSQLKDEYQRLFNVCVIRQAKAKQVEAILSKIEPNRIGITQSESHWEFRGISSV